VGGETHVVRETKPRKEGNRRRGRGGEFFVLGGGGNQGRRDTSGEGKIWDDRTKKITDDHTSRRKVRVRNSGFTGRKGGVPDLR